MNITAKENIPGGIALMLATMFFFVTLDATAKYLMQFYATAQVIWGRFFFHTFLVLITIVFMHSGGRGYLLSNKPPLQIWRSILMLATNGLFFMAVKTVDLTTASSIMFLSPIVVALLAIPLLGETVGIRRIISVIIGFVGALVIVRPGVIEFDIAMGFLLVATVTHALYQIYTRQIRVYDHPLTSLLYTGVVGMIVMSIIVPFYWQQPTLSHWPFFVLMGMAGCLGHFCLIRSLRIAPASVVTPFSYTTLIWATGFSYILFDELPDIWVYIGSVLIIASGFYILFREQKVKQSG